jgi:hypothetical protein
MNQFVTVFLCIASAGCAGSGAVLRGDSEGPNVSLHIEARIAKEGDKGMGKVKVEVSNHAEDAVGVDVDAMRLRDGKGLRYAPLGKERRFVGRDGRATVRRVAHGAINIPPGATQAIELEFADLPPEETFSVVMPQLYRLGIAGQVGLKSIRVPLRVAEGEAIASSAGDGGFYDPFEE